MVAAFSKNGDAPPDGWKMVRLGDVDKVAFSGVDKRTVQGEVPVQLCNSATILTSSTTATYAQEWISCGLLLHLRNASDGA